MDDAYLGGERGGGKSGRGRPGKKPIVVAVQTSAEGRPQRVKIRRIARFKRKRVIMSGSTVVTDGLSCFRGLADAGCVHVALPTGLGRRAAMLGNIKSAILATHRVVRKSTSTARSPILNGASIAASTLPA